MSKIEELEEIAFNLNEEYSYLLDDWINKNTISHRVQVLIDIDQDREKIIQLAKNDMLRRIEKHLFIEEIKRDEIKEGTIQINVAFEWFKN